MGFSNLAGESTSKDTDLTKEITKAIDLILDDFKTSDNDMAQELKNLIGENDRGCVGLHSMKPSDDFNLSLIEIDFGCGSTTVSGFGDIIKAICDGIRSLRLASSEKKLLNEQTRSVKLDNDQKELAIINSKTETIAHILGLSMENQEDIETLQKACLPLVRYLISNPQEKVGGYEYNLDEDTKLIEYFNSHKNKS